MPNYSSNPLYNMSQLSPYDASFYNKDMLWNASQNRPNTQYAGRATNTPPTNGSNLGSGKDFSEFFTAKKPKKPRVTTRPMYNQQYEDGSYVPGTEKPGEQFPNSNGFMPVSKEVQRQYPGRMY